MRILEVTILLLCAVGLYASVFMDGKSRRADRGELREPSVVQTPRARVFGRVPNAAFGAVYYVGLGIAAPALANVGVWTSAFAASIAAAAFSGYLAYSLLFVTRMPCRFCWTGHAINWLLPVVLLAAHP